MKKLIVIILIFFLMPSVFATQAPTWEEVMLDTASYLYQAVTTPQIGSVGGEWTILGLARSDADIPEEYYQNYYRAVERNVIKQRGVLHNRKYTEYSRLILALTAIGKNPEDVAGYNLLTPLGDYEKTVWQGVNGSIWALLALDSKDYKIPHNPDAPVQATRALYINNILASQLADGGWALSGEISDPDVTGMVLQALAKYQDIPSVQQAIKDALLCISKKQSADGGFAGWGATSCESCVQIIVGLCELGISIDDPRFVKNGNNILDNLLLYYEKGNGFSHTLGGKSNLMATEQGLYALVALYRMQNGKSSLYHMDDAPSISESPTAGLLGKHPDVTKKKIVTPGKTFADISGHEVQAAIEELAARAIIQGKTDTAFEPDSTMTRAEFSTTVVRGLGLSKKADIRFADVMANDWFFDSVNTAYHYGIVNGVSDTEFHPHGTITRQEAAVMVARAAKLCGMKTAMETTEIRNILAGFLDYMTAADWARDELAFCYREGILPDTALHICPAETVTRGEIAQMLWNMLTLTKLD